MKTAAMGVTLLFGVLYLLMPPAAGAGSAAVEEAPTLSVFYGAKTTHRVTVRSERGATAVLEFPQGVLLGMRFPAAGNPVMPEALALPNTFRGDIEILARRQDELSPDESTSARDIMARAPVVMQLKGVVLDVAEVVEAGKPLPASGAGSS